MAGLYRDGGGRLQERITEEDPVRHQNQDIDIQISCWPWEVQSTFVLPHIQSTLFCSTFFHGAGRRGSGIEVPAKGQDFYALKKKAAALKEAGVNSHFYVSSLTAHEWQSWRCSLHEFAPLLFQD